MAEAIKWVKRARTPKGYSWDEKNYQIVPKVVRLMATLAGGKLLLLRVVGSHKRAYCLQSVTLEGNPIIPGHKAFIGY